MRIRRTLAAALGAAAMCAACSSSASTSSLGPGSTALVRADVLALSQASAAADWPAAQQAMAQLRTDLADAVAAGGITPDQAKTIRADIALIATDLGARTATPTSTPTRTKSATRLTPAPKPTKHHGKGKHGDG